MKRNQPTRSNKPNTKPRIVNSHRLAETRGGADLGIAVADRPLTEDLMQQQHNEVLIEL